MTKLLEQIYIVKPSRIKAFHYNSSYVKKYDEYVEGWKIKASKWHEFNF